MSKVADRERVSSSEEVGIIDDVRFVEPVINDGPTGPAPEPYTNYKAFEDAHVIPGQVLCEGYSPRHAVDSACHTRFPLNGENIKRHIDGGCGGGFRFNIKKIKDRTSPFWKSLKDTGLDIQELRCDHCQAVIPLTATSINLHLIPHRGKNRSTAVATQLLITFIKEQTILEAEQLDPYLSNSY